MEYTEQQKAEFKQDFARRRRNQIMVSVPVVALVLVVAIADDRSNSSTLLGLPLAIAGPLFVAVVVAALIFSLRNWRCPACNKYLGRALNPRFCQNCGVALRDAPGVVAL